MARKKKKIASRVPVEVTVAAITVTDVDSSCCCSHVFFRQLCAVNVELGVERLCKVKEGSSVVSDAVDTAVLTELGAETEAEAEAATRSTASVKEDCCCEVFRKLSVNLLKAYSHLEHSDTLKGLGEFFEDYTCSKRKDILEGLSEEAGPAIEVANGEAAGIEAAVVNESECSCQCENDLEKFWCDEYLRIGVGRQCLELKRLLKKKETEENSGPVNHSKVIWHKGGVL
jgi:hypothetical protein